MEYDGLSKDDLVKELTTREKRIEALVSELHRQSFADGHPPPSEEDEKNKAIDKPQIKKSLADPLQNSHTGEHALFQADEIFTSLAEQSPNMIFVNRKGRVVFANNLAAETMGYSKQDFYSPDFDFMSLIAPESRHTIRANFMAHMQGEEVAPYEYSLVTKRGQRIDAIINTKLIQFDGDPAILGIVTDISDRIRSEKALIASIERYETLVETSLEAITQTDLNGRITFASKNTLIIHGYDTPEEILGSDALDLIAPEERDRAIANSKQAMELGSVRNVEYTMLQRDGSRFIGELNATVMKGADGTPVGFVASVRDVTQRKLLEEELRQTEKMQALGQLAGGIAHDFNNQLTAIMGFSQLIFDGAQDSKTRDFSAKIMNISNQASQLTQQLLAFARKGKHFSQPVDVHNAISEVISILEHTVDRRIGFSQQLKAKPSTIEGDPSQIQNLFLNVAINARDAMPNGGKIDFETDAVIIGEDATEGETSAMEPGPYVRVRISDSGIGMDRSTLGRIFEPFFTTKGIGKGCGMGLPAAFGAVESHNGSITVSSEVGQGTVVSVYLPSVEAKVPDTPEVAETSRALTDRRILIIDDEYTVLTSLKHTLTLAGCDVTTHSDAEEAVAFFRDAFGQIDLVILDLVMPKMHGRDVLLAMKKIDPGVKCILISGHLMNGKVQEILAIGALSFLQKPFKPAALIRAISEVI